MTTSQPAGRDEQRRAEPPVPDTPGVDPMDFLRALLSISPEDAAAAREDAAQAMKPDEREP